MTLTLVSPKTPTWENVIFDVETDGLLDQLSVIHCLVLRDLETNAVMSCADDPRAQHLGYERIFSGLQILHNATKVYAHNGVSFDMPALRKLFPDFTLRGTLRDTFLVAGMRYAHVAQYDYDLARKGKFPGKLAGSHTLEAWGHRLGCHKGEYTAWCEAQGLEPWAEWRPEMQTYCEQDTETTRRLVLYLHRAGGLSLQAVEIEHKLREYLSQQERNGWPFDLEKAQALYAHLAARREVLGAQLIEAFGSWQAPDGKPFVPKRDNAKLGYTKGVPVQKWKTVEFNPTSRDHIEHVLRTRYGWEPTSFTQSGKAELDDDTIKALPIPEAPLLAEYLLISKRIGQLAEGKQAWLNHATKDGYEGGRKTYRYHIHGRVKQNHAVTHRAAHSSPNVAQTPKVGVPYGAECRELWDVPDGWVMVGSDASGLELRCLAHYMARWDDGAYAQIVLHGDIHSANRDALGLTGKAGRDAAKTFIYAFLYGEGNEARGRNLHRIGVPMPRTRRMKNGSYTEDESAYYSAMGAYFKKKFLDGLPALKYLLDAVEAKAKKDGYLLLPDGRRVYIRHQHAALNSLLQGAGAIICKAWIVEFSRRLTEEFGPQGWDGQWAALGWIHDEVQIAVRPEIAPRVQEILVESIRSITHLFNWRCPLDGEAKVGANWKETH